MSDYIKDIAGETVATVVGDMGAVRWFLDNGRRGDRLASTNELMSDLTSDLMPDLAVTFDGDGQVKGERK